MSPRKKVADQSGSGQQNSTTDEAPSHLRTVQTQPLATQSEHKPTCQSAQHGTSVSVMPRCTRASTLKRMEEGNVDDQQTQPGSLPGAKRMWHKRAGNLFLLNLRQDLEQRFRHYQKNADDLQSSGASVVTSTQDFFQLTLRSACAYDRRVALNHWNTCRAHAL